MAFLIIPMTNVISRMIENFDWIKVYWKNLSDLTKRHVKIKKYAKLDEVATNKAIFYFIRIKDGWAHWKMPQKSISCVIKSLYGQNSSLN